MFARLYYRSYAQYDRLAIYTSSLTHLPLALVFYNLAVLLFSVPLSPLTLTGQHRV
jgi:hypothetical protein